MVTKHKRMKANKRHKQIVKEHNLKSKSGKVLAPGPMSSQ